MAARDPALAIKRDAAARHDHVYVWMMRHRRAPGVEHGGDADGSAYVLWIGRDCEHGLGCGLEQQVVEEEAQRRNRTVDGRRTHPGLRLMQLEAAKVLGRCRIRRAAEKGCKGSDVADIVVASLRAEIAHAHVFDHALAQWTDGLLAHRGAPVLRWRFLTS